jgi:hypothetical protein
MWESFNGKAFFGGDHPVTAILAVVAIVLACLLIGLAFFALPEGRTAHHWEVEGAVTSNRFATGLSP